MKQDVFEVLLYLFENYMYDEADLEQDKESLKKELIDAGFRQNEIRKAFDWLEGLATMQSQRESYPLAGIASIRIYSDEEAEKLDSECRGFLLFLEQMGVLDHATREMVVDRVMALDSDEIDLEQIKWVVLMVLFNQPGREAAVAWMEDLVLDEMTGLLH
jgi:Smg protein